MKTQFLAIVLVVTTGMAFSQNVHRGDRENGNNFNRVSNNNQERRTNSNTRHESFFNGRQEQHQRISEVSNHDRTVASRNFGLENRNHPTNIGSYRSEGREGFSSYKKSENRERPERHDRYSAQINRPYFHEKIGRAYDHESNYDERRTRYDYRTYYGEGSRRYDYRDPMRSRFVWSVNMYRDYSLYYPEIKFWKYPIGYSICRIPAYNASYYLGEIATIYGKVMGTFYDTERDQYILFMDNQQFRILLQGEEARAFSGRPDQYFLDQNIAVTGYVNQQDGSPSIVVRKAQQIDLY